ncbi:MAG TPA: isoprenylcysteine carboxylmethyltransferase family protein [Terracidiphilus sp.]|jgi:protein-S-isoprenylcysteine O-methyltransferase Ste14|nr:isoprenylcysteine carboxylmethyltransferase family protein [Terracidiphilus sp.]
MIWFYQWAFPVVWLTFLIYWRVMSRGVKASQRTEAAGPQIFRAVVFLTMIVILSVPNLPAPFLYKQILPWSEWDYFAGLAITIGGLSFAVWARVHLGRNWSQAVMIKQDHELITTGPYRFVRHPIYTGILTGFLGVAVAMLQVRGVVAFALISVALWSKLRLEEKWMESHFGATYAAYAQRVPALVPRPW